MKKFVMLIIFYVFLSYLMWFLSNSPSTMTTIILILVTLMSGAMMPLYLHKTEKTNFVFRNTMNSLLFTGASTVIFFDSFDNIFFYLVFLFIFSISFFSGIVWSKKLKLKKILILLLISVILSLCSLLINKVEFTNHSFPLSNDFVFTAFLKRPVVSFGNNPFVMKEGQGLVKAKEISNLTRIHYGWPVIYGYKQVYTKNKVDDYVFIIEIPRFVFSVAVYFIMTYLFSIIFFSIKQRKIKFKHDSKKY